MGSDRIDTASAADLQRRFDERGERLDEYRKRITELEAIAKDHERIVHAVRNLRKYVAVEVNEGDGRRVALSWNGSQLGPVGNPNYELYEFAETVEKWLHAELDKILDGAATFASTNEQRMEAERDAAIQRAEKVEAVLESAIPVEAERSVIVELKKTMQIYRLRALEGKGAGGSWLTSRYQTALRARPQNSAMGSHSS